MSRPAEPPKMQRRWVQPWRMWLALGTLSILPLIALLGELGGQAYKSVLHIATVYAVLTLSFRVMGKRELSQLSPFDLVTLMLIPEILSDAVQGQGELSSSISGLSAVLLLVLITSFLSQRFPKFQKLVEPSPTLLVADGKLLERNMNLERIAPDELFSEMHKQGIEGLAAVRFAVLEGDGTISFVRQES